MSEKFLVMYGPLARQINRDTGYISVYVYLQNDRFYIAKKL